jgi:hypothetical protein
LGQGWFSSLQVPGAVPGICDAVGALVRLVTRLSSNVSLKYLETWFLSFHVYFIHVKSRLVYEKINLFFFISNLAIFSLCYVLSSVHQAPASAPWSS